MGVFETILSLRAIRHFTNQPISEETLTHILQAGRWTGSAKNIQPWHFIVVRQRETLNGLAECGGFAGHLRGAAVAVAIVTGQESWYGLDVGRVAQNMMLVAWAEGIGSCIASLQDAPRVQALLRLPSEKHVQTAISFGYPDPEGATTIEGQPREKVLFSLGRRSLADLVYEEQWGQPRAVGSGS